MTYGSVSLASIIRVLGGIYPGISDLNHDSSTLAGGGV